MMEPRPYGTYTTLTNACIPQQQQPPPECPPPPYSSNQRNNFSPSEGSTVYYQQQQQPQPQQIIYVTSEIPNQRYLNNNGEIPIAERNVENDNQNEEVGFYFYFEIKYGKLAS
uniref:Uncharacterized protein n=1 Tax=Panagrolaimus sp. PS1159 TaxID=55785 RepID=A0AC35GC89_9BILA